MLQRDDVGVHDRSPDSGTDDRTGRDVRDPVRVVVDAREADAAGQTVHDISRRRVMCRDRRRQREGLRGVTRRK